MIGGWALIEAESMEEAVGWTKRFLSIVSIVGEGEGRIRPVF